MRCDHLVATHLPKAVESQHDFISLKPNRGCSGSGQFDCMNPVRYLLLILFLLYSSTLVALTTVTVKHYTVSGNTTEALHKAMTINSPIGTAGLTEFSTGKTEFEIIKNDDGKYQFISASIDQKIVITLPKWKDRPTATNCVSEQWDNAMAALKMHEDNHNKMYQEFENKFNTRASTLPPEENKLDLYNKLQQMMQDILDEIQVEQYLYDKRTNFGQTEGVSLSSC